jgi:hypothetical protein
MNVMLLKYVEKNIAKMIENYSKIHVLEILKILYKKYDWNYSLYDSKFRSFTRFKLNYIIIKINKNIEIKIMKDLFASVTYEPEMLDRKYQKFTINFHTTNYDKQINIEQHEIYDTLNMMLSGYNVDRCHINIKIKLLIYCSQFINYSKIAANNVYMNSPDYISSQYNGKMIQLNNIFSEEIQNNIKYSCSAQGRFNTFFIIDIQNWLNSHTKN